ncbi:RluA family pseudouridine synthase [Hydrogenophaga sp.]|uniref:RluA family pseudouridine synthase n=1 Tax=Hydrogenophaga sp. TaxID=1904254 RepID=UPI0026294086|nr:RluA family pseudouridine synthase [Hydrogenophaga sp.]MDM7949424.1 RluA family pseudouridine synthase [Hydrogenophaga sp.]
MTSSLTPLHVDPWLLVFDKPAGLLCVPGRGPDKQDCLSARAQAQWPDALIVHRLDMATSGLVLMARGIEAQRALSLAFEQRRVHKRYTAVVSGALANPEPDNGWSTIDLPLLLDWQNRPRSIVCHEHGKPSLTRWRLESPKDGDPGGRTRLALEPVTGRSHQLRVHLQAIGHPIVGDPLYAAAPPDPSQRLLLHAQALNCNHPHSGEALHFVAPCPF